ncbi:MHS family proline/betaine transporter-like MFS transporter [Streptomyces sp. Amel2xB2]|uniref:MFS transporter n=1 Tax=Streptomyces sp. Amel2xB2 TaxID=1305829 RepID=UPI000DBA6C1B|nr:MFS transporter [Streptomyces sp. Amel2xB2]RAJ69622.1 MHS family proline/betaine transporter-like MFS transporter [Streptomyces sp. Amel2xB2]
MSEQLVQNAPPGARAAVVKRAVVAGVVGHFVEWYDYGVYAYVATTLAVVFFKSSDPNAALLAVFATFAVAFFARPVGGLFFGSLGDRLGRQRCLATVVVMMSVSTFAIGVLPGYATAGVLAPVLLLLARLMQGFSAGGEIAGATSFINEYAPVGRRGVLSSLLPAASATGLLFGATLMTILTANLSESQLTAWGWRVPFLIALPLGLIGLYLRLKIEDTPLFRALVAAEQHDPTPLRSSVTRQFRPIAVAFGATLSYGVGFYVVMSYMPTYLQEVTTFGSTSVFVVTTAVLLAHIVSLPLSGALSDRIGRKPVITVASVGLVVCTYPAFLLVSQGSSLVYAILGGAVLGALIAATAAPLFAFMAEMFPTRVRNSSVSVGYNASVMLFGGTAPFIATFLIGWTGSHIAPSFYLVAAAAATALTLYRTKTGEKISKELPQT